MSRDAVQLRGAAAPNPGHQAVPVEGAEPKCAPAGLAGGGLSPALVRLMAVAAGVAVASDYYAQPLLPELAHEIGVSVAQAGAIVTTAQLGYALGLLLIVPLGDLIEPRRLVVGVSLLTALGLLLTALSPGLGGILVGTALAGLCSVLAQILIPVAATLAAPGKRGSVVGTIMSGLLLGVLLARTAAGALAGLGGWRTVYWAGALALVLLAVILVRRLPGQRPAHRLSYPQLLASVFVLLREEGELRLRAALGALSFASFSVLWTSLAFMLAAPPFRFATGTIGLFGLAGAAGVVAASLAGRMSDRGQGKSATRLGCLALLLSWWPLLAGAHSLSLLILGILLLDMAVLMIHVSNQGAIYRIRPEARSRLTAAYMSCYFAGGALGSFVSAFAYSRGGWSGVALAGAVFSVLCLLVWELARSAGLRQELEAS
ncbi:MFS transporter [Niveibacterium terrae]|uniref:MFS transporter n=1 Tax=Niveibacterium terrae TaxID=3373598 RepID=UPI003A901377